MTTEELIKWANLDGMPELREQFNRLIWISKNEARIEIWREFGEQARMAVDFGLLSSYPGGLKKRKLKEFDFSDIEK
jgi:hypothetical protein